MYKNSVFSNYQQLSTVVIPVVKASTVPDPQNVEMWTAPWEIDKYPCISQVLWFLFHIRRFVIMTNAVFLPIRQILPKGVE